MPPTWLTQWSPIIESFIRTAALVAGAVIAAMGLYTWRRQLRGQRDYDLAQKLMKAVYMVRNEVELARDSSIMPHEMDAAIKRLGDYEKGNQAKQSEAVYMARFQKVAIQYGELETQMLEAEATWGSEWTGVIGDLEKCVKELRSAFRRFALEQERPGYDAEKRNEIERIVYGYKDKSEDLFAQKVDAAVKKFEDIARPHLGDRLRKPRK